MTKYVLTTISGAWEFIINASAGLGAVLILRWFWWRINAYTEISAMVISFVVAVLFQFALPEVKNGVDPEWWQMAHWQLVMGIFITTITWLVVTFLTQPTSEETLKGFVIE